MVVQLFADDCTPLGHAVKFLNVVSKFVQTTKAFVLTIYLKKTEVFHQKLLQVICMPLHFDMDGYPVNSVVHFTCLKGTTSNDASKAKDVDNHIAKSQLFLLAPRNMYGEANHYALAPRSKYVSGHHHPSL